VKQKIFSPFYPLLLSAPKANRSSDISFAQRPSTTSLLVSWKNVVPGLPNSAKDLIAEHDNLRAHDPSNTTIPALNICIVDARFLLARHGGIKLSRVTIGLTPVNFGPF
jgi:hypothetical protein